MFTMNMTGTKWEIFVASVELISDFTFEGVTVKHIADKIDIKAPSLYNHFASKEEILDTIYRYLESYYLLDGMTGAAKRLQDVENGDIHAMILEKWRWPQDMHDILRRILRIVFNRMHFDNRARDLFYNTAVKWSYTLDKPFLEKAVELGRTAVFDIEAYLQIKIALDIYVTMRFTWDDTLPDDLWRRAEELLIKRIVLNTSDEK